MSTAVPSLNGGSPFPWLRLKLGLPIDPSFSYPAPNPPASPSDLPSTFRHIPTPFCHHYPSGTAPPSLWLLRGLPVPAFPPSKALLYPNPAASTWNVNKSSSPVGSSPPGCSGEPRVPTSPAPPEHRAGQGPEAKSAGVRLRGLSRRGTVCTCE